MTIKVKLLSIFRKYGEKIQDGVLEVPDGSSLLDIGLLLGIPEKYLLIILVNGKQRRPHEVPREGDEVVFVPPAIGGG